MRAGVKNSAGKKASACLTGANFSLAELARMFQSIAKVCSPLRPDSPTGESGFLGLSGPMPDLLAVGRLYFLHASGMFRRLSPFAS